MANYRRYRDGRLFFFTLVSHRRRVLFADAGPRRLLREAMAATCASRPWTTEAIVLLPDHVHMLWRMPDADADYSGRLAVTKRRFTLAYLAAGGAEGDLSASQRRQRYRGVWQKRFWEHRIRDARDFHMHVDYIHMNPVKHGLASRPGEWPFSSFRRYVEMGWYDADWCGRADLPQTVEYVWTE